MQFTCRGLFCVVTAIAVALGVWSWTAIPGVVAGILLALALIAAIAQPDLDAARQLHLVAYLCILLELAWCAAGGFQIVNASAPLNNYWNTIGPILLRLKSSSWALLPLLLVASLILVTRCGIRSIAPSRATRSVVALATINLLIMYLGLQLVCWIGLPRGMYDDWKLH